MSRLAGKNWLSLFSIDQTKDYWRDRQRQLRARNVSQMANEAERPMILSKPYLDGISGREVLYFSLSFSEKSREFNLSVNEDVANARRIKLS